LSVNGICCGAPFPSSYGVENNVSLMKPFAIYRYNKKIVSPFLQHFIICIIVLLFLYLYAQFIVFQMTDGYTL